MIKKKVILLQVFYMNSIKSINYTLKNDLYYKSSIRY